MCFLLFQCRTSRNIGLCCYIFGEVHTKNDSPFAFIEMFFLAEPGGFVGPQHNDTHMLHAEGTTCSKIKNAEVANLLQTKVWERRGSTCTEWSHLKLLSHTPWQAEAAALVFMGSRANMEPSRDG
ncbi:hypothetical protein XELAEV_18045878mg [Xenopus laevis]|uniref:Uncharacterized protein n=1 Tax=Xenopus laevis TaxID=8355 RepID=A0A974BSA7_XENLA|nr:hypothetical protein XELAEV_18045878mg [Xenopus laevis]